jgi:hypothetical protein
LYFISETQAFGNIIEAGYDDWQTTYESGTVLVDKSIYLKLFKRRAPVAVFRPRRFGKTMLLRMFEYFFNPPINPNDLTDKKQRLEKLLINKVPGFIEEYCGKYPTIYLDLKASGVLYYS